MRLPEKELEIEGAFKWKDNIERASQLKGQLQLVVTIKYFFN